jgi:N-acetylglucosaminyldiphosphoundecaprenol N-acetyl-beta-D-mannosaminyltransferase
MTSPRSAPDATAVVLGTRFHLVTLGDLLGRVVELARRSASEPAIVAHVNVHALNLAHESAWYRAFLNAADLVFCDGFGVLLGARMLGHRVAATHRMTCPDFLDDLGRTLAREELSLFLVAAHPGVVEEAIHLLRRRAPQLRVAGHHGHFDKEGPENDAVVAAISQFRADVLIVGFGMPLQERWIAANRHRFGARVVMPVGACLDYYTGRIARAPRWATDRGLEWLSRLITEPRRLARRYVVGNPLFVARVARECIGRAATRFTR